MENKKTVWRIQEWSTEVPSRNRDEVKVGITYDWEDDGDPVEAEYGDFDSKEEALKYASDHRLCDGELIGCHDMGHYFLIHELWLQEIELTLDDDGDVEYEDERGANPLCYWETPADWKWKADIEAYNRLSMTTIVKWCKDHKLYLINDTSRERYYKLLCEEDLLDELLDDNQ